MELQRLRRRERLATTLAWSEVLRDQNEIFDHRLVLDMGFVFDRAPTLALVLGHVGPILGSAGELDVVGHDQGARSQPILFEDAPQVAQVGFLGVVRPFSSPTLIRSSGCSRTRR